jgi:hypothetical protein
MTTTDERERSVDELALARAALDKGEPKHALHHLANVLVDRPSDETVNLLLEKAAHGIDVVQLFKDDHSLGGALARAWAQQRAGDPAAFITLAQAVEQFSDRGYENLLATWLAAHRAAGRPLPKEATFACMRAMVLACRSTVGLNRLLPGEQELLRGYGAVAQELAKDPASLEREPMGPSSVSGVLRRLGAYDEALAVAGSGTHLRAMARGLAHRAAGQGAESARAFEEAHALEKDETYLIEQARGHYVAGDFVRARQLLATANVQSDPESDALRALVGAEPQRDRVETLDRIRRKSAGVLDVPELHDATANLMRQVLAQRVAWESVVAAVSGWESPSCRLALAIATANSTEIGRAPYTQDSGQLDFDPLVEARQVGLRSWMRVGRHVAQALGPPPEYLWHALRPVHMTSGGLPELWEAARAAAKPLKAHDALLLVAAMVHPEVAVVRPGLPDSLLRYQTCAALVMAALDTPWSGPKGDTLSALVLGPVDWASCAAVVATAELARRDPDCCRQARALLIRAVPTLLPHSAEPRAGALTTALMTLPGVAQSVREELEAWHKKVFTESEPGAEKPAPSQRAELQTAQPEKARSWAHVVALGATLLAMLAWWLLHSV